MGCKGSKAATAPKVESKPETTTTAPAEEKDTASTLLEKGADGQKSPNTALEALAEAVEAPLEALTETAAAVVAAVTGAVTPTAAADSEQTAAAEQAAPKEAATPAEGERAASPAAAEIAKKVELEELPPQGQVTTKAGPATVAKDNSSFLFRCCAAPPIQ